MKIVHRTQKSDCDTSRFVTLSRMRRTVRRRRTAIRAMHAAMSEALPAISEANFAAIVREHRGFVRRVLRRRGVRGADVDDLTQNVFLVAYEYRNELPRTRSKLRKWFAGVAFRLAQNWRRLRWIRRIELVDPLKLNRLIDETSEDTEAAAILCARIDRLPQIRRNVARMRLQGFSFSEISCALGVSRSSVFTEWQRAKTEFLKEGKRCK